MGKYRAYPEYKDSGVEWLGDVPSHWNIFSSKRIFSHRKEPATDCAEQLAASQTYGVIPQKKLMEMSGQRVVLALKGTSGFRQVAKDDFVISLRSFEGGIEHSAYDGCVSPAYTVLKSVKNIAPPFYRYLLKSMPFICALQASTDSLRDGKQINFEQFCQLTLPLPELDEQTQIATFLDRETAKIDRLIAKQEALIELLKEKRQAVISHAVTKGLDPDAPMKDSGVEWLGAIPAHWTLTKFAALANVVRGGSPRPAGDPRFFNGDHIPWVTVAEITKDTEMFLTNTETFLTEEGSRHSRLIKEGVLVLTNSGATLGVPKIMKIDGCCNDGVVAFENLSPKIKIEFAYFYLDMMTGVYRDRVKQGAGQPNLNTSIVKNTYVGIPSIKEQAEIVKFIQQQDAKFTELERQACKAVTFLHERRTALISAAVTGKIDVRE